ncbi:MAG TPA: ribulose-phosphate 3-epimerase [Phycisphaerales bacterium]|nr:ribulose-phosphate 3-epimerase [Phycisphaerales bacterium]
MRSLIKSPRRLPLIAPSILSADFAHMGRDCRSVLGLSSGGDLGDIEAAELLHVDVMDGHFVPNLTMGPDMCRGLKRELPRCFLDVHLMVTDPLAFAKPFVDAGADHLTMHVEVLPADGVEAACRQVRELGVTVGLAINPPTPVEAILPHVQHADLILIMSVNPGRSGQAFIPEVLDKTRAISEELAPDQRLEMDGGIKPDNVGECLDAGCDVVVAASAIFGVPAARRASVIRALRG